MLFSSADIARFNLDGEQDFAQRSKCVSVRAQILVVNGTASYTLDGACLSIIQITYRGFRLDPTPQRDLRNSLFSGTQGGRPYYYIFNNIGTGTIQLFPVPIENLSGAVTDLYKSPDIDNQCIIEYWAAPDGTTKLIPLYFRQRLLKAYVMKECYAMEGKGQNLKAAKYWTVKYAKLAEDYDDLLSQLHNKPRNLNPGILPGRQYKKAPPILPIARFGIGVDW